VTPPVAAVVLASRGGARLDATLASVAWAAERIALVPPRAASGALPPGVARRDVTPALADVTAQPWLLFLAEGEVVEPALAAAIDAAVRAGDEVVFGVPLEVRALGAVVHPRTAPIRLVPTRAARLALRPHVVPTLVAGGQPVRRLDARLVVAGSGSLTDAVSELDADAAALAAVLRAAGRRTTIWRATRAAIGAAAPVLCAPRGARHVSWARWRLGIFAAYRAIVAYAKTWEQAHVEDAA